MSKKMQARRVVLAELSRDLDPPMFWGLLVLPDNLTIDDIVPLYHQWSKLDDCDADFPDWLIEHGFGEEEAGFCWLDPYSVKDE